MKTAFLITARLKSTRLPKKILLEVAGKPLIVHMLDRIKRALTIDKIIICTSTNPQDDPLEEIAGQELHIRRLILLSFSNPLLHQVLFELSIPFCFYFCSFCISC